MVLKCNACEAIVRPRNTSKVCPKCSKGVLEEMNFHEEKKEPISIETIFERKAENANIKVNEKIL